MAIEDVGARIDEILADQAAGERLVDYLATRESGAPRFTGSRFDTLGGGGDLPAVRDRYTADDLIAVTCLSVTVPTQAALWILEGAGALELTALLELIPADVDLWDAGKEHVADGSPAERLWLLLRTREGIAWAIAGKLLARKRPRLIPVYDSVVRGLLGHPKNAWLALRGAFGDEPRRVERLESLRATAGAEHLSLLRTFDIVTWMRGRHLRQPTS